MPTHSRRSKSVAAASSFFKSTLAFFMVLWWTLGGPAGESDSATVAKGSRGEPVPSFRNDVLPVLTKVGCNSGGCHGALAGKGGLKLSLRGYDPEADYFVLTRQALGRRIDLDQPHESLMLVKPTTALPHGGGHRIDEGSEEYDILYHWIRGGAPPPLPNDPVVEAIRVHPATARLKPKATFQVTVKAVYSDGRVRDVTRWCRFSTTEEGVASVDDQGLVTVRGPGEAGINVIFASRVATARIQSPFPTSVSDNIFAEELQSLRTTGLSRTIDEHVLAKLRALRLPPSPVCNDYEFVRRAFLDATGTLPTPEEVERFVADPSPDKRARLVDALLARPEFVDYWAYKWSDLLLISSRRLPQPAVWAFYQFVRQSVADNKPWNQFAREILTASGSNLENGAANYFVLHKDVTDLTETTSVTFLGMSITCARCHNHPLEKWTQDQYWRFANLFSRVGLKNGDRSGEVIVQSQPFGDVLHPRRGRPMPPTPLDGKPLAIDSRSDRRRYLADWLTAPENPYFARALVNRVWRHFLGRGLVEPEDDLRQTNPATHPQLLTALEKDFVDHGYDVRHLIRGIMNSRTYQRSSVPNAHNGADDRFYSHYLVRRLPAEVVLDAYSQVTGVPTRFDKIRVGTTGGVANTKSFPPGTRALQLPDNRIVSRFLDTFGRPERAQTCSCERQDDSSITQALHLNNGQTLNDKLRDSNSRVRRWARQKLDDGTVVDKLFLLALSRPPSAKEKETLTRLLKEATADPQTGRPQAIEDLFWAVLTSKEFLFNH